MNNYIIIENSLKLLVKFLGVKDRKALSFPTQHKSRVVAHALTISTCL